MSGFLMKLMLSGIAVFAFVGTANAQDLVYEPVNPSFGGNSFNSAHLLALANAQNDYERPETETSASSDLDRFVRSLQSRLLSSLSTQVANAIFGEDAQDEGTIQFGDQTVSFVRTLEGIELTITDGDGNVTVITIPTFQSIGEETDDSEEGAEGSSVQSKSAEFITGQRLTGTESLQDAALLGSSSLDPIQQPIQ